MRLLPSILRNSSGTTLRDSVAPVESGSRVVICVGRFLGVGLGRRCVKRRGWRSHDAFVQMCPARRLGEPCLADSSTHNLIAPSPDCTCSYCVSSGDLSAFIVSSHGSKNVADLVNKSWIGFNLLLFKIIYWRENDF